MSLLVQAVVASEGLFEGPVHRLEQQVSKREHSGNPAAEAADLNNAIASAIASLEGQLSGMADDAADIIGFQIAMLEDPELAAPCWHLIGNYASADGAWGATLDQQIENYSSSDDEYFQARASDLQDIRDRVLRHLHGATSIATPAGHILVGRDISPSVFLGHDWSQGGAIVLQEGSQTSHVAMLARARGIAMMVQAKALPAEASGTAQVDAINGNMVLDPSADDQLNFARHRQALEQIQRNDAAFLSGPAKLKDGTPLSVMINVADPHDVDGVDIAHCDGVGLMRSEFLFRDGEPLPDEDMQYRAYRRVLEWAAGKPVIIRTLDIGGDKPIAGLTPGHESNPFLGLRGVRLTLRRPDVFKVQLRALARAAMHGQLLVMLPMVSVPDELEASRRLLLQVVAELEADNIACKLPQLGIMAEVPSVAVAPEAFPQTAFFSIGSNDLTQYVMAASRDNGDLGGLSDGANVAVLKLMRNLADFGREKAVPISICGDMASDPSKLQALVDCGLRRFSVAPARLAQIKRRFSEIS